MAGTIQVLYTWQKTSMYDWYPHAFQTVGATTQVTCKQHSSREVLVEKAVLFWLCFGTKLIGKAWSTCTENPVLLLGGGWQNILWAF